MNAIELLDTQHDDVDKLLGKAEQASGQAKRKLFEEIADLLAIHAALEERIFYPTVKARTTEEQLRESLEEHLSVKRLITDLLAHSANDETFDAKLTLLGEQVRHHVKEERTALFPRVRELFDRDQLEAIGQEMTDLLAKLQQNPAPRLLVPSQIFAAPPLERPEPLMARMRKLLAGWRKLLTEARRPMRKRHA